MILKQKEEVNLFDKFSLVVPPKLIWHQDGIPGQRVFFISDKKETVVVSFEEGMKPRDMTTDTAKDIPTVSYQCCKDGKYIHQKRNAAGNTAYSFFHIELEDDDGSTLCLPGQMVVFCEYKWTDGVEPILLDIMNGIDLCKSKGGGGD